MNFEENIQLKEVNNSDHEFLFELLKNRESDANISHKMMPNFDEHVKFVVSEPYSAWYIIIVNDKKLGSIYLSKQNEIGIFLINEMKGKGLGKIVLKLLMNRHPRSRYLANISPNNKQSLKFFEKNNFKLIQYTYEFINKNSK
jgi:RimJ/RimL family protein N-acetyltransferase